MRFRWRKDPGRRPGIAIRATPNEGSSRTIIDLTRAFGPAWGFMTGWISFFAGFSAPIAAAALAFSNYLGYFFPELKQGHARYVLGSGPFSIHLGGEQALACLLIAGFSVLNCLGVRRTARVQNALTGAKLG